MMMPEMDGITLLRNAFEIDPNLVGIMMTGHGTIGTAVEALKAGALDYILKPFKLSAVLPVLSRALSVRQLRMENIQLRGAVSIYELSMAIAFSVDRDTVLKRSWMPRCNKTRTADVSILLPSEDGKELHVALARGRNAEHMSSQTLPDKRRSYRSGSIYAGRWYRTRELRGFSPLSEAFRGAHERDLGSDAHRRQVRRHSEFRSTASAGADHDRPDESAEHRCGHGRLGSWKEHRSSNDCAPRNNAIAGLPKMRRTSCFVMSCLRSAASRM